MDIHKAFVFQYLSMAFSYPGEELFQILENGLTDLDESLRKLEINFNTNSLMPLLRDSRNKLLDIQGEFNSLFGTTLKAPSRETAYEIDKSVRRAAELADIEGFYRAFQVQLSAPMEADGLVAELEFLAILIEKKLYAEKNRNQQGAEICTDAYRKFLEDHLGRWYKTFARRLETATGEEYYHQMNELLVAFLDKEKSIIQRKHRESKPLL